MFVEKSNLAAAIGLFAILAGTLARMPSSNSPGSLPKTFFPVLFILPTYQPTSNNRGGKGRKHRENLPGRLVIERKMPTFWPKNKHFLKNENWILKIEKMIGCLLRLEQVKTDLLSYLFGIKP
jgi:hypothetical protein